MQTSFSVRLDFPQIIALITDLPDEYKMAIFKLLRNQLPHNQKFIDTVRGTLDVEQYRKPENADKDWDCIEGKWPGDETDEEIYKALEELS